MQLTNGRVSVVIPSKNEGEWIHNTVQDVLKIGGPLKEVVVVDDGSTDGSCDLLENLDQRVPVRVLKTTGVGISAARNAGAAEATGEDLVFVDAHTRPGQDWLQEICEVLDMGHAGAAPLVVPFTPDGTVDETGGVLGRWYLAGRPPYEVGAWSPQKGKAVPLGVGGCQAFRRVAFETIGGYCDDFTFGGEDTEICLRMWSRKGTIGAAPGARVLSLTKDWDARPDKDDILASTWVNLVKAEVLHWNAARLTAMWATILADWSDHRDLFSMVWEACHVRSVLDLRRRYRAEATLSDDDIFAMFPELS